MNVEKLSVLLALKDVELGEEPRRWGVRSALEPAGVLHDGHHPILVAHVEEVNSGPQQVVADPKLAHFFGPESFYPPGERFGADGP
eukprot:4934232-Pyramimonas_sp.AAC.1